MVDRRCMSVPNAGPRLGLGDGDLDRTVDAVTRRDFGYQNDYEAGSTSCTSGSPAWSRRAAPSLLAMPGCGALTAAKLVGESAGIGRFADEAKFARHADVAPIPVWSGNTAVVA